MKALVTDDVNVNYLSFFPVNKNADMVNKWGRVHIVRNYPQQFKPVAVYHKLVSKNYTQHHHQQHERNKRIFYPYENSTLFYLMYSLTIIIRNLPWPLMDYCSHVLLPLHTHTTTTTTSHPVKAALTDTTYFIFFKSSILCNTSHKSVFIQHWSAYQTHCMTHSFQYKQHLLPQWPYN